MTHWRPADPAEDERIVAMSVALFASDPAPAPVAGAQIRATLERFRAEPIRGRALVLDADGTPAGYAFLVSFWSNELGGEICTVDELYIAPAWRGQGHGSRLVDELRRGGTVWPTRPVALELEVSPSNTDALRLYERLGFAVKRNATMRLMVAD
jgi:ribosomal protein S18 acetylase RimI-like enzyme